MDDPVMLLLGLGALVLGVPAILGALYVVMIGVRGAVHLLGLFAEGGFPGVGVYILLWALLAPLMAVVCVVTGLVHERLDTTAHSRPDQDQGLTRAERLERERRRGLGYER